MDTSSHHQQEAIAATINRCYSLLAEKESNIVNELLKDYKEFYQWEHYPKNDYQDKETLCQYYYHSHPSPDIDRLHEHGHFHVFIREGAIPSQFKPIYTSEKYQKDKSDDLCHLFGINMDKNGFPIGLFTVNHWVTKGIWHNAEVIDYLLEAFHLNQRSDQIVNVWLNAMVQLFRPVIKELNYKRDEVVQHWQHTHPKTDVFADRRLEITSFVSLEED